MFTLPGGTPARPPPGESRCGGRQRETSYRRAPFPPPPTSTPPRAISSVLPVSSANHTRRLRFPAPPHAPQMLCRVKPGSRRNPLEIESRLHDELLGECEADQVHILEWRTAGVFGK